MLIPNKWSNRLSMRLFSIKAGNLSNKLKENQANSDNLLCENNKITKTLYNSLTKSLQEWGCTLMTTGW